MPDDRIGRAEDRHSPTLGVVLSRRHGCSPVPPANSAHSDKTRAELTGVEPVTPCLQSGGAGLVEHRWCQQATNRRIGNREVAYLLLQFPAAGSLAASHRAPLSSRASRLSRVFSPPDHVAMWMSCAVQTLSSTLMRKIPQVERTPLAGKCRPPGRTWPTTPGANSMSRTRLPIEACHGRASHWWHPQCWHHSDE